MTIDHPDGGEVAGERAGRPPLDGVRVLEYTHALAGRTAGALLADLGAAVVQVPAGGDAISLADPERVWSDRRKRLTGTGTGAGQRVTEVRRLLPAADLFISDLPPGRLEQSGLDAMSVREGGRRIVHLWMPPYGTQGRASYLEADPLLLSAVSGYAGSHPAVASRPVAPVIPTFSYLHGAMGAAAAVAGLVGRGRTGEGNSVRVSGLDAMGGVLGSLMISRDDADAFLAAGRGITGAPYFRLFQAGDGAWFYLAALTPAIFTRALDAIGRLDLLVREDVAGEFANLLLPGTREEVNAELEAVFAARTGDEWLRVLRAASVPAAPVWSREQWLDAGIGPAGRLSRYEHPAAGALTVPGPPLEFSGTPMLAGGAYRGEAPAWGRESTVPAWDLESTAPAWDLESRDRESAEPSSGAGMAAASPLPLRGLRVIDLSSFYAGPLGAALLADFGADVVKVEPPDGDPYRVYAGSYGAVNQRKRAVPLDLADPGARSAFLRLLAGADALLDNFTPGSLDRLGLSDAAVSEANPGLIRCTVSAFGGGNELSGTPGFDPVLQAMTGLALAQGGAGRPVPSSAPVVDAATGALTALGILAARYARGDGGPGQHVRTCLASAAVFIQSADITFYDGRPPARAGRLDYLGHDAARRVYGTSTGWLAIGAATDAQRTALLAVAGHPEWSALDDPALAARLQEAFAAGSRETWLRELAAAGVPAVRALEYATGIADRYLSANGFSHVLEVPGMGRFRVVRSLSQWEGGSSPRPARFPVLGGGAAELLLAAGVDQALVDGLLDKNGLLDK